MRPEKPHNCACGHILLGPTGVNNQRDQLGLEEPDGSDPQRLALERYQAAARGLAAIGRPGRQMLAGHRNLMRHVSRAAFHLADRRIAAIASSVEVGRERQWLGISHSWFLAARSVFAPRLWWKLTFRCRTLRRRSSQIRAPISLGAAKANCDVPGDRPSKRQRTEFYPVLG